MSATKTQLPAYKEYIAGMAQSGISNPTVVINQPLSSGAIAWTTTGAGEFTGTSAGLFTATKTRGWVNLDGTDASVVTASFVYVDTNTVKIITYLGGVPSNHSLFNYDVRIVVFP